MSFFFCKQKAGYEIRLSLMGSELCIKDSSIPAEVYQASRKARVRLNEIVNRSWREEDIPEEMVEGLFIMLYKNKGSPDDMSKYRAISPVSHTHLTLPTTSIV